MENLWIRRAVIHPRVEKQASQRVYSMKADLIPAGNRAVFGSFCVSVAFFLPEKKAVSTVSTACGGSCCGEKRRMEQGMKPHAGQVIQSSSTGRGLFLIVLQADGHHP